MATPINVFLTGASSGIGLETAQLLTENNCRVWGTSREAARLPVLANFHPVAMDLTDVNSIRERFAEALRAAGHFDVLINNAGAGYFSPVETQPDEMVREQFQLLVHGPLELIRLALPHMRQLKQGRIINVSSLAAQFPVPYLGAYSAAKAAMVSLSASLRLELAHTKVRVVDVQPGDIHTNFHTATRRLPAALGAADDARMDRAWQTIGRNMAGAPSPERVAEAIVKIVFQANPPAVVTVGNLFQARIGPLLARVAPRGWIEKFLRVYYRL
jgi:short-subunit dehydrogenase